MKTIDIQNQNGHLVLTRYDDETKKKELQIFDKDIRTFLEKLTNYSI